MNQNLIKCLITLFLMGYMASAECTGSPNAGCGQFGDSSSCQAYLRHNYQCEWYYYSGGYHCDGNPYADCHTWDNDYGMCGESYWHNYGCNWDDNPRCTGYAGGYGYGGDNTYWIRNWYTQSYGNFADYVGTEDYPDLSFDEDWSNGEIYDGHYDYIGFESSITVNIDSDDWYDFHIGCDDGCRLSIDGSNIFDFWEDQGYFTTSQSVYLIAGEHTYNLDYFEDGGYAHLMFSGPGTPISSGTDCNGFGSQNDCENAGCTWQTGTCFGQYYCDQDYFGCVTSPGCTWQPGWYYFACSGSLTCTQTNEAACTTLTGCTWLCSEPAILANWQINCDQNCTYNGYNNNFIKTVTLSSTQKGYVNIQNSNITIQNISAEKPNCQIGIGQNTKLIIKPNS